LTTIIKSALLVLIFWAGSLFAQETASFKVQQLKNKRVKAAYTDKWAGLESELRARKVDPAKLEVFIRIFKQEKELELWVRNKNAGQYTFFKKIAICASSGELGPKRKEGDYQVPEGIYDISAFNPNSSYYLALQVGYPNKSDRILKTGQRAGGEIMIHGNCVTIGCIPLEDDPVKDVYILCVEARNNKNTPRCEIYPCRFTDENVKALKTKYPTEKNNFWDGIRPAYSYFEKNKTPISYTINQKGAYVYN
jgi:murein L,D-transpeptidase YafK